MNKNVYAFLLLYLCTSLSVHSQTLPPHYRDSTVVRFHRAILAYDALYNCRRTDSKVDSIARSANVTGDRAFDTLFKPILSNVFIGSNDLVQDGPASSFTQDPDKGTLSINFTKFKNPKRWNLFNMGVFSKATDGVFGIYTTGSWSSEIGVNLSWSSIRTRSRYFMADQCDSITTSGMRQRHYVELLVRLRNLADQRVTVLARHQTVQDSLAYLWAGAPPNINSAGTDIDRLSAEFKKLDSLKKNIIATTPDSLAFFNPDYYRKAIDSAISVFEIKNDIFTGYYVRWWTIRGSVSNNTVTFSTDSLLAAKKLDYYPKNLIKISAGWNMSWISENQTRLYFIRAGFDLGLHNYADHPSVKKPGVRYDTTAATYVVYNKNATYLARYDDLRPNIFTFEPSIYGNHFFGKDKKILGVEGRADARLPLHRPSAITKEIYPATYSLTVGPVFRLKKDSDVSKGTVGVEVGIVDAPVNDNAWRYFTAKLKVGVPFSALIK